MNRKSKNGESERDYESTARDKALRPDKKLEYRSKDHKDTFNAREI